MAAPLFVKAFSSLFLGFGKSAQAAKSFSQAGAMAAGQFSRGLSSNLVKGVNAANLGAKIGADLNKGFAAAFKDVAYKRSTEMWGRTSAAMLYGGTGARATAAGNALKTYGGSAETYSQTMMGLQSRLTGLKYGNTGWLVEAMQKSGGLLNIRGSGENGFATGEELIRNLAKIKDQIPVGQFNAVANALGLTTDIQKSILDNNLDFLNKGNYLTDIQEKRLAELGRSQQETSKIWERVSQEWGANTAKYWGWFEKTKQDVGSTVLKLMEAAGNGKNTDAEKDKSLSTVLANPLRVSSYQEKFSGESNKSYLEAIKENDYSNASIMSYSLMRDMPVEQAVAIAREYKNGKGINSFAPVTEEDRKKALEIKTEYEKKKKSASDAGLSDYSDQHWYNPFSWSKNDPLREKGYAEEKIAILERAKNKLTEEGRLDYEDIKAFPWTKDFGMNASLAVTGWKGYEKLPKETLIRTIDDLLAYMREKVEAANEKMPLMEYDQTPKISNPVDQVAAWQAQYSAAAAEAAAQRNSNLTVDVNNKDMNVNVHVDGTLNGVGSTIVTEMKEGLKQRDESFNDTFGVLGSQHLRDYILSGSGK